MEILVGMSANFHIRARASSVLYDFLKDLKVRGIGDVILLPINICPVVVYVVIKSGFLIRFVDICHETYCLDEQLALAIIGEEKEKIAAVLFNHTYGTNYEPSNFFNTVKSTYPSIQLIDDRCLCVPTLEQIHASADLTLYSLGYGKYIDLAGGGLGILKNRVDKVIENYVKDDLIQIDNSAKSACAVELYQDKIKKNCWLDLRESVEKDILIKISTLEAEISNMKFHKSKINSIYSRLLPADLLIQTTGFDWRFNLLIDNRDQVLNEIFREGLFASKHYKRIRYKESIHNSYPVAEFVENKVLNLFNDYHFSAEQAEQITKIIKRYI